MAKGNTDIDETVTFLQKLNGANYILIFLNFMLITIKQMILEKFHVDGDSYDEE